VIKQTGGDMRRLWYSFRLIFCGLDLLEGRQGDGSSVFAKPRRKNRPLVFPFRQLMQSFHKNINML